MHDELRARLRAIGDRLDAVTPGQWRDDRWGGVTAEDGSRVCCGAILGPCDGDFFRQAKEDVRWLLGLVTSLVWADDDDGA